MTSSKWNPTSFIDSRHGEQVFYVIRCALAASLAYEAACFAGLDDPVWAPVSALVVSQETTAATLGAVAGRCRGTLLGALVALLVSWGGTAIGLPLLLQLALAVALSAALSIGRPHIRIATWTVTIVLVTAGAGENTSMVAGARAFGVIFGAIIGGVTAAFAREMHFFVFRATTLAPARAPSADAGGD